MSLSKIRTRIYLTKDQYRSAIRLAHFHRTSFAHVVREALRAYLKNRDRWNNEPISKHIGLFKGDRDTSSNHDHYIYDYD